MPLSRKPDAIAWPASPKPMKEMRGVLRRVIACILQFVMPGLEPGNQRLCSAAI
jgi:hypothetical protein